MNPVKDLFAGLSALNMKTASDMAFGQESIARMAAESVRTQGWLNALSNAKPEKSLLMTSMASFRKTLVPGNAREARFICWGASVPVGQDNYVLIEDDAMFQRLIRYVDSFVNDVRIFRRCYRGLLASYFGYDPEDLANEKGRSNWGILKKYLQKRIECLQESDMAEPDWLLTIREHSNLLGDNPCDRYGRGFLTGEQAEIDLSASIWASRAIFNARFSAATACDDKEFAGYIPVLTRMLVNRRFSRFLDQGLAILLDRCSSCDNAIEYSELIAFSVTHWNPPWAEQSHKWNMVSKNARMMVEKWIRFDLVGRFFKFFSSDGLNATRRTDFWRKYSGRMTDMFVALGRDSMRDKRHDLLEFRKLMAGRLLAIDDGLSIPHNNALLMKIENHWFVEFGIAGGSVFIYESLPFDVSESSDINISMLKDRNSAIERLQHKDNYHGFSIWEDQFGFYLYNLIGP